MIDQPIRMEGFAPIFSLILNNPKFIVEQSIVLTSAPSSQKEQLQTQQRLTATKASLN